MGPTVASSIEFMEVLPQEGGKCPPNDAVSQGYETVWRYVASDPPTPDDFKSHAAAKKPLPPGQDPCRWASCSLFLSDDGSYESLPKPRKRYKYIAKISITAMCGFTKQSGIHVDFWRFKTFKANVQQVFEL
jgi:hypothetical protein